MFPIIEVPANASRFFDSFEKALQQPIGKIKITYDDVEDYYYNSQFDSSLNLYDSFYYTKDSNQLMNSLKIFYPFVEKYNLLNIIDIGCGQGEYVQSLNKLNINATGYDPALREPTSNLKNEYFDPERTEGKNEETFIMRCVLPHIANPFMYINALFLRSPKSKIYIEFQRLEWILENKSWISISHDHVNLFTIKDFQTKYNIIESGTFSRGEWGFVLFSRAEENHARVNQNAYSTLDNQLKKLFERRSQQLDQLKSINSPILIYGAAGKGIVFSHAFKSNGGKDIFCIDSDPGRQEKYLECSGVKVISPANALQNFGPDTLVLVMNKNHMEAVNEIFKGSLKIFSLTNFSSGPGSNSGFSS
jgi:hypothetical protein